MSKIHPEELQGVAFQVVLESGDARGIIHKAFALMREANFSEAEAKLEMANDVIIRAHGSQAHLLQKYASGSNFDVDILMVHSQDHLMTTITLKEVAIEMLHLYKKIG